MRVASFLAAALLASIGEASAWGFAAHRIIAENAAAGLPPAMAPFYRSATAALSDASIEPDSLLKERDGEREKRRHYIDLDELGSPPFRDLPFDEREARETFGGDRVDRAGLLPWRVVSVYGQLREAFRKSDWPKVVSRSGWLSHYVADAYQPLHTTKNHDGQETCNDGVHAVFETDLIDRNKTLYRAGAALPESFVPEVIPEPRRFIFGEILRAYGMVEEILRADTDSIRAVKRQRKDYFDEMERQVGPLARRQMAGATAASASLWFSAWVEAGRPELPASPGPRPPK